MAQTILPTYAHAGPSTDTDPSRGLPGTPDLVLELLALERPTWGEVRDRIPAAHPRNDGDEGGGSDDGDAGDGSGDGDGDGDASGSDDEDDDDADGKVDAAAFARMRRELKAAKKREADAKSKAAREEGRYRELYEEEKANREKLEAEQETAKRERAVNAAAAKFKARDVDDVLAVLSRQGDLQDIEDEADAERALKKLVKAKPHLFDAAKPKRQIATGPKAGDDEDDEDDDDAKKRRRRAAGVSRLRQGVDAALKKSSTT